MDFVVQEVGELGGVLPVEVLGSGALDLAGFGQVGVGDAGGVAGDGEGVAAVDPQRYPGGLVGRQGGFGAGLAAGEYGLMAEIAEHGPASVA